MFRFSTELVQDADAVGFRCRFDKSGEDELEERIVIDDIESESVVGGVDRVDSRRDVDPFTRLRDVVETLLPVSRSSASCPVDSLIFSRPASSSAASWAGVWAEPRCSMTVSLPWRFVTIWTAVAPDAVGTFLSRRLMYLFYGPI